MEKVFSSLQAVSPAPFHISFRGVHLQLGGHNGARFETVGSKHLGHRLPFVNSEVSDILVASLAPDDLVCGEGMSRCSLASNQNPWWWELEV